MARKTSSAQVKSMKVVGHEKWINLATNSDVGPVVLPRFAAVTKNDLLYFCGIKNKAIWALSADEPKKKIPIFPAYKFNKQFRLGSKRLPFDVSEIETREEYDAYMSLEKFHYRSNPYLIEQEESIETGGGGRKAVLMASLQIGNKRTFVGYIELTMPLMMVAPRHRAFERPFTHSKRTINWAKWDQSALRENLNLIVRIARVVTHPTFRGIGLSHQLIAQAEIFSKERWHIGNRSPIFMEISAEMLNYFDFVSGCGFTYCGHSDGNQKRIAKDMRQMARGQKISSGIMTLQNKYFGALQSFAELKDISIEAAIKSVEKIADNEDPESQVDEVSWVLLRKLFRLPKPYYVKGLDEDAQRYLKGVEVSSPINSKIEIKKVNPKIDIRNLTVKATVELPNSESVKVIKQAFGLEGSEIKQTLLELSSFTANQGNVFLLAGASGTGKSIFLDMLGFQDRGIHDNIDIKFESFKVSRTAELEKIPPDSIVIDYFSNKYGLAESLRTLAIVGLSEAIPLVKPFWMLSKGQKYRALLAELILQKAEIWLLDEFGADLDPITATVLAGKLRKLADKYGVIVFVAAANNGHFFQALRPTRVITFDFGVEPELKITTEYKSELFEKV